MDFNSMIANVRRAMSLDRTFYQEVAYDERVRFVPSLRAN
jgi:hypothetical protein